MDSIISVSDLTKTFTLSKKQQKLQKIRPETLGAAQRISGVSPGDVAVLMIKLEQMRREERA